MPVSAAPAARRHPIRTLRGVSIILATLAAAAIVTGLAHPDRLSACIGAAVAFVVLALAVGLPLDTYAKCGPRDPWPVANHTVSTSVAGLAVVVACAHTGDLSLPDGDGCYWLRLPSTGEPVDATDAVRVATTATAARPALIRLADQPAPACPPDDPHGQAWEPTRAGHALLARVRNTGPRHIRTYLNNV